jgi:hypothetical protein
MDIVFMQLKNLQGVFSEAQLNARIQKIKVTEKDWQREMENFMSKPIKQLT